MKINEVLASYRGQQTNEFVQALAPIAGAIGRGAVAGAQALGKGATSAAGAISNTIGKAAPMGQQVAQQAGQQLAKTTSNVKSGVDSIKSVLQQTGGQNIDTNKLSQTLATQSPGQRLDPIAAKELQKMLPGLGAAMSNPSSANAIKQAINTGMQAQQKQSQTQQQQQPTTAGSVGSTSNTVGPA